MRSRGKETGALREAAVLLRRAPDTGESKEREERESQRENFTGD